MPFIHVTGLSKSYAVGVNRLTVLKNLELSLERGEMVAIVGASGVGKSTLLHVLGGLDSPDAGSVRIDHVDLASLPDEALVAFRNQHVGFVFQFHHLLPEFSALENAAMPLRIARKSASACRERATNLLGRLGLSERLEHRPGMLSGGEPTGDLDEHTAETLHDLLQEMHREHGLTSVIATHNPKLAAACDRVLRLEDGRLRGV